MKNLSLSLLHTSSPPSLPFHTQELGVPSSTRQEVVLGDLEIEDRKEEEEGYWSRNWSYNPDQSIDQSIQG